jgi:hypothetical protein
MRTDSYPAKLYFVSVLILAVVLMAALPAAAEVKPGDFITPNNAYKVKDLLSPGEYWRVVTGCR